LVPSGISIVKALQPMQGTGLWSMLALWYKTSKWLPCNYLFFQCIDLQKWTHCTALRCGLLQENMYAPISLTRTKFRFLVLSQRGVDPRRGCVPDTYWQ
jgi:hypothetical protein